jgi:HSP20 family protein
MAMLPDAFEALFNLQSALDAYRQSDWLERSTTGAGPFPPVNAFRKGDDFVIIAEVPGVKKSDLEIQVKDQVIRIAGTKSVDYADKASVHRRERSTGRFNRTFTIPVRIDAERIKAECHDGILALYLPRAEQDKPQSIKIS